MEIFDVRDLNFRYPDGDFALKDISFTVGRGEFVVLYGASGSGKSTLLRLLKPEITPQGEKSGTVLYLGEDISSLDTRRSAAGIGYVTQEPEQQIVTDKVRHELAFGLENLGYQRDYIARRTAETAAAFGLTAIYDSDTDILSGGQKQLLNLAAAAVMSPSVIILDEPSARLDPIAAEKLADMLQKLNRDFGITIITVEHSAEYVVPLCDRLIVMEKGRITANDDPRSVISQLGEKNGLLCGMPAASRIYSALHTKLNNNIVCPLTVREGRNFICDNFGNKISAVSRENAIRSDTIALRFKEVSFRYTRDGRDILNGADMTIYKGELFCILGGNGSGKTTALSAAAGLLKIYGGKIEVFGKDIGKYRNGALYHELLAMLPQEVRCVFLKSSVAQELSAVGISADELPFDISHLLERHPYDLSGGEAQLVGIAKALAAKPKLLLLDEPTKGLDASSKRMIAEVLRDMCRNGMTVVMVTHDTELAAEYADRCALFFDGCIAACGAPGEFFPGNNYYTTPVSRMTRGYYENAVTVADAVQLCSENIITEAEHD